MKIDEMPAGRELDALVAEKVMGIKVGERIRNVPISEVVKLPSREFAPGDVVPLDFIRPYSTSISAAWEVVEKMVGDWYVVDVVCEKNGDAYVEIHRQTPDGLRMPVGPLFKSESATVPLAICRAALKAVADQLGNTPDVAKQAYIQSVKEEG